MRKHKIPSDLVFVKKTNIRAIAETFTKRYAQRSPVTTFQEMIQGNASAERLSKDEILDLYGVNRSQLAHVYKRLEKKAKAMGITVTYVDMTVYSEDTHYGNKKNEATKHAETARSDGQELLLERDLEKAGGIQGRMYDLLHLAFGHMVQWSTKNRCMLLSKKRAWSIGYRNHEGSAKRVIDMMSLYEFEAGMLAIEVLQETLASTLMQKKNKEAIIQYFVDYVYADRGYIIQHYRGNHESFQKFWTFGCAVPPRRKFPIVTEFIKRHSVEVGLIKDAQKVA